MDDKFKIFNQLLSCAIAIFGFARFDRGTRPFKFKTVETTTNVLINSYLSVSIKN